ncbi:hypothetical protein TNCV_3529471 [Trichonephila clavipes]|uniref:Uncharacterized protein n=1 Tax=Trichonephila clavipes TaxID=2585209 RepID=A0A8X6RB44_TRICX|nr:hypothetical protein TNCV_3529471 [Trichonephila clavipes]
MGNALAEQHFSNLEKIEKWLDEEFAAKDKQFFWYAARAGDGSRNLNHGQVTRTTRELVPPLLTTTSHRWEDVCDLDRFKVHHSPTRRVRKEIFLIEFVTQWSRINLKQYRKPNKPFKGYSVKKKRDVNEGDKTIITRIFLHSQCHIA